MPKHALHHSGMPKGNIKRASTSAPIVALIYRQLTRVLVSEPLR